MKTCGFFSRSSARLSCALVAVCCLRAFSSHAGTNSPIAAAPAKSVESGTASYYADKYQGLPTASGEIFNMYELTAAHPTLKFGTIVKVTNTVNHRTVRVRINDRGPFVGKRVIDLSLAAAAELRMVRDGLAPVTIEVVAN